MEGERNNSLWERISVYVGFGTNGDYVSTVHQVLNSMSQVFALVDFVPITLMVLTVFISIVSLQ